MGRLYNIKKLKIISEKLQTIIDNKNSDAYSTVDVKLLIMEHTLIDNETFNMMIPRTPNNPWSIDDFYYFNKSLKHLIKNQE